MPNPTHDRVTHDQVRQRAEEVLHRISEEYHIEITMDEVGDPVEGKMTPYRFTMKATDVAVRKVLCSTQGKGEGSEGLEGAQRGRVER